MTLQLLGPNQERIAHFVGNRLVFYPEARTSNVARNLMQRGIEIVDPNIRSQLQCSGHITYPSRNASPEALLCFKNAFEKYYFPIFLAPNRFTLIELTT